MKTIEEDLFDIGYLLQHTFPGFVNWQWRLQYIGLRIELVHLKIQLRFLK